MFAKQTNALGKAEGNIPYEEWLRCRLRVITKAFPLRGRGTTIVVDEV